MTTDTATATAETTATRTRPAWLTIETISLAVVTALLVLALAGILPWGTTWLEAAGTFSGALTVWMLARNNQWGWWVGQVNVVLFAWLFYTVQLYAEVGLQAVYLATGFYAIWLWLRGGEDHQGRKVTNLPAKHWAWIVPAFGATWFAVYELMLILDGAAPLWDSLTATISLAAQALLMGRFVQSWWLWVAVDVIYVPLYLSRDLTLTAVLYVGFFFMAAAGLVAFRKIAREGGTA